MSFLMQSGRMPLLRSLSLLALRQQLGFLGADLGSTDFLTSAGFENDISKSMSELLYSPLRIGRKKGTDNEIANGSKVPVFLRYQWLFRHQSLFAPFFCLFKSAICNSDEVGKSEVRRICPLSPVVRSHTATTPDPFFCGLNAANQQPPEEQMV